MTLRSTCLALTLAGLAAAGAVGCGSSGDAPPREAKRGGTLTVATAHDVTNFGQFALTDNESIRAISQITEGLYKSDARGRVRPWLATSDQVTSGGRVHTFTLRRGVRFSDGKPLTAADVVFTLNRARKSVQWGFLLGDVASTQARGDETVVVRLTKPVAALHANLALFFTGIVPAGFGGKTAAEFAQRPVGTGPFMLSRWDKGTRVVLTRNPKYWVKGRPLLDRVELRGIPDDNSRITQLRSKSVDIAANPPWPQLDAIDRAPGVHVGTFALAQVDSMQLNTKKPPFDDHRVREAVSLALDRASMVKASLSGRGEPAGSFLAPSVPMAITVPAPPREEAIAKAKRLLQEAGRPARPIEIMYFNGNTMAATLGQIIQDNLKDVGLRVTLQPLDQSAVLQRGSKGDYTAALSALTSDVLDPSELSALYVGTNGFSTFSNPPALAKLAGQAAREQDTARRADLYRQLQEAVVGDHGFVPLQVEPWVWGISDRVAGFTVNGTGIFDLSTVGLSAGA